MSRLHVPAKIRQLYEVEEHKHAAAILSTEFPAEYKEICAVLSRFRFTEAQIRTPGGNESAIPKTFSSMLDPYGWKERELNAQVIIDGTEVVNTTTHKIDYLKGRVAFDLEWNSKDQTFDRDLYAFSAFFEYNKISVGVLVTRSTKLHDYFETLGTYFDKHGTERPIKGKYGASTTHMDKLLPRLKEGRSGGCPVLALGITKKLLK